MTVSELGERRLLARVLARLPAPPPAVVLGVGDDAAVVAARRNALTVLTTDALVEGVHFDWAFSAPSDVGHKALAVNLSDLGAMGARPRWVLLSLALPGTFPVAGVDGLLDGLLALAREHEVFVVGGNLTRSPGPALIDVTAVGESGPRRFLTRRGGRPGDELYVSGTIGAAAAGLAMLRQQDTSDESAPAAGMTAREGSSPVSGCVGRYRRPLPRVRLGLALAQARAVRAAVDLSDGLADALEQIAAASSCGVEVDAAALPIDAEAATWWRAHGQDALTAALAGGDDYELLVAVPPAWRGRLRHARHRVADPPLTRIGRLTRDPAVRALIREGSREHLPQGFEHWRALGTETENGRRG